MICSDLIQRYGTDVLVPVMTTTPTYPTGDTKVLQQALNLYLLFVVEHKVIYIYVYIIFVYKCTFQLAWSVTYH